MSTIHFLKNIETGELRDFIVGPHPEVPDGWESIESKVDASSGIPGWVQDAIFEDDSLRPMTPEEKAAKEADETARLRTEEFNANRAVHAAAKVFLEEINALRTKTGLQPLDPDVLEERIRQEYLSS